MIKMIATFFKKIFKSSFYDNLAKIIQGAYASVMGVFVILIAFSILLSLLAHGCSICHSIAGADCFVLSEEKIAEVQKEQNELGKQLAYYRQEYEKYERKINADTATHAELKNYEKAIEEYNKRVKPYNKAGEKVEKYSEERRNDLISQEKHKESAMEATSTAVAFWTFGGICFGSSLFIALMFLLARLENHLKKLSEKESD